ncbi:Alpha-1,3/1,6-mannosyltransferase ALG2 [Caenorhabditis elegans]|uniref:Alpha-1,3/1,6-mannosyltransferase ALG2 n=2 Tax=Caenorhabditis elegans TaxID=6239 RepID=A0ACB0DPI2_CAEEL|nr:Alpha-1,3/1,6-mannosyltransferase ALG2 [Caenorhabditis elegans]CAI9668241.1 Alpha-1,3/1,6-mannosyltransferase ALG2 [Caenorhabditis elegans]
MSSSTLNNNITTKKMHVVIVHPEQWNGGSDRCTVALIRHFVSQGHRVTWLTTMIDEYWKNHTFDGVEIREVGLKLHPGDWWSQNVALGWHMVFSNLNPDVAIIDHSASCVPMIKWRFPQCKILFYCHFPQQLVTPSRFFLYRWYAKLIGIVEEELFGHIDQIFVNSNFTATQFCKVMPNIEKNKVRVVYPPCDIDWIVSASERPVSRAQRAKNETYTFLSMNRFWPEKRLDIIIEAASILKQKGYHFHVQLAGSVMPHIPESRIYYEVLQRMTEELNVTDMVTFIPSPTDKVKFQLYQQCDTALYTPPNEHFGIVPIEALDQRRPVIVCDSGGPAETVLEDITGTKIAKPCGELLAEAMLHHMNKRDWPELDTDEGYAKQRHRLETEFSTRGFCGNIDRAIAEMMGTLEISSSEPTTTPLVDTIVHQPTATEVYSKPQQYNKAAHSRRAQA